MAGFGRRIERPERRNAVDGATAQALYDAFKTFDADDALDVAVRHLVYEIGQSLGAERGADEGGQDTGAGGFEHRETPYLFPKNITYPASPRNPFQWAVGSANS